MEKKVLTLFILMCSSIILYTTKGIFSDTYITNDIRNSEDIYFPRQDKDGTTRHTNLFSYPDYTDNEIIDVGKVSHFDVYLNKDILYE